MKSRGYKSATVGILTTLAAAGAGIAGLYYGKKYMDDTCQAESDKLDTLINSFLNRTITTPPYNLNVPLNFPDSFPISANITTPNGTFPFNTTAHIDLPSSLNIPLGPLTDTTKNLLSFIMGLDGINFLQSIPSEVRKDCDADITPGLLAIGAFTLAILLWLNGITFGFGSKISSHDYRISKRKNEIKELKEQMNPQPLHEVRSVVL